MTRIVLISVDNQRMSKLVFELRSELKRVNGLLATEIQKNETLTKYLQSSNMRVLMLSAEVRRLYKKSEELDRQLIINQQLRQNLKNALTRVL